MGFSLDQAFGIYPKAMILHEKRAEILANNLANQDTPGYKARDIDFRAALSSAKKGTDSANSSEIFRSHQNHLPLSNAYALQHLKYRMPHTPSLDGNTVDGQVEQAEFAENSMRYLASLRFLNGNIEGLMTAIRGSK